jgi:tetratricopeptide (TPR) repeat protein
MRAREHPLRRASSLVLLLGLLLGLLVGHGAGLRAMEAEESAERPPAASSAVDLALEATRRGDEAGLRAAVAAAEGDPVALAAGLLMRRARGSLAAPPADADALEAAARVATTCADEPRAVGLGGLVAQWAGWTDAQLAREAALDGHVARAGHGELTPEQLVELRGARGSPSAVLALDAHAQQLRKSGADAAAAAALRAAAEAADRLPWPLLRTRVRSELAQALLLQEAYAEALATCDVGLELAHSLGVPGHVGVYQRARAGALAGLDRLDEALEAIEQAYVGRTIAFSASVESQRSGILSRLGRRAEALALGERVLAAQEAQGDAAAIALALNSLASFEAREGRLARAITLTERAREVLAAAPATDQVRRLRATALHNLASAERNLGRPDRAIALFEASEAERCALGLHTAADRSAQQRATALEDGGRFAEALELQRALLARAGERGRHDAAAFADARVASLLRKLGQGDAAYAHAAAALERARAAGVSAFALDGLEVILAESNPDAAAALERLDTHLARRGGRMGPATASHAAALRGHLCLALGRLDDAAAAFRVTFAAFRRRTTGLGDADVGRSVQSQRAIDAALRVARLRLEHAAGEPARRRALGDAFHVSESTRALLLLDGLANRDALVAARVPPQVAREERDARRRLEAALRAVANLPAGGAEVQLERARADLAHAEREAQAAAARLRRELHFGGEATAPEPVDLEALERALAPGDGYLAFEPHGDELLALVVSARGADLVSLGVRAALDARGVAWLDRLAAGADDSALAAALYDALLRPLAPLLDGSTRLVIAPDASRACLPFAALLRREPGGGQRLLERWETVLVPSASTWLALAAEASRTPKGEGVVAVGRPTPDPAAGALPDLPRSEEEARRVAALYPAERRTLLLGAAATHAALQAALAPARGRRAVLHFAGHALMHPERASMSSLVLASGERWLLDDLSEQGCAVDLALLSACDTALAPNLLGEGPVGFPRRFFLAGCPRVVVTAWPIVDGAAAPLLERFHSELRSSGAAAALRTAQLARLAAGDPPASWAAFLLWGLPD